MIQKLINFASRLGFSTTAKNIYWVFFGNAMSFVLTFFTLIIIAKSISKEEYGIFFALFTLANLLSELGEAGVGAALSRFIPQEVIAKNHHEANTYVSAGFRIELAIGLFIFTIIFLFTPMLANYLFDKTPSVNVLIIAIMTIFLILYVFSSFALSAFQKFKEVAFLNIFYSFIRIVMLFILLLINHIFLTTVLLIYLFAAILTWVYGIFLMKPSFLRTPVSKDKIEKIFHFTKFLSVQKIFVSTSSRLDLLMLVPLSSSYEAGVYGLASRFALVYPVLIGSLGQVLAPKFGEYKKGSQALSFFKKVLLVIGLFLLSQLIFYLVAQPLILLLLPEYAEAIPVLKALLIAMVGFIVATPFVSFLIYTLKKPHITTLSSGLQLAIIFLSNLYFIPKYGRIGPAIGIGLGNLVVCIVVISATIYYLRKEI
jgi:teichuronic acid exporter